MWTPQLVCHFPALERAIVEVLDAVSAVDHVRLVYNGSGAGQWSHYEILTENGDGTLEPFAEEVPEPVAPEPGDA